eukprot:TRINITY_DN30223_c0_g1_i1.p1 TRINITY_DN30223_c0_g1~~TRINITY_DN30223_c0_g1_i1.p1  ORF type:complete len:448 (+),score=160.86 TRINITY_DN30223_c0_g1_i1:49-1392(+)
MLRRCGICCAQAAQGRGALASTTALFRPSYGAFAPTHPALALPAGPMSWTGGSKRRRKRRKVLTRRAQADPVIVAAAQLKQAANEPASSIDADAIGDTEGAYMPDPVHQVQKEDPRFPRGDFEWVDVSGEGMSSDEAFRELATGILMEHDVPKGLQADFRQKGLLPMIHDNGTHTLIVCRMANYGIEEAYSGKPDAGKSSDSWSVGDLTNRVSILVVPEAKKVITIHRHTVGYEASLAETYRTQKDTMTLEDFVWFTMRKMLAVIYQAQLSNKLSFDMYESQLIEATQQGKELMGKGFSKGVYEVMRRSGVNARVLLSTFFVLESIREAPPTWATQCHRNMQFRRLMARVRHAVNLSEEINNSAKDLLNLHFGTAAHRTNELVKVLTLLNAIFIPLAFLTGFYGMNFEYLPGTGEVIEGIPGVYFFFMQAVMVCGSLIFWFKSRGWT